MSDAQPYSPHRIWIAYTAPDGAQLEFKIVAPDREILMLLTGIAEKSSLPAADFVHRVLSDK